MHKKQIHESIKDYHWMMKVLITKREQSSNGLTAQYGIEATLPKPQGETRDPVYQEILRIEKYDKNIKKMKDRVLFIQTHSEEITNPKNKIILDMLLDGLPMKDIANELDMSISGVNKRKNIIVERMFQSAKSAKGARVLG